MALKKLAIDAFLEDHRSLEALASRSLENQILQTIYGSLEKEMAVAIARQNRLMAQLDDLPIGAPALEEAIDSHPIVVGPETRPVEVISLMSQTRGNCCTLSDGDSLSAEISMQEGRSSRVLVMREQQLLGIFTERDLEAEKLGRFAKGNAGSKLSAVVESNGLHSLQPLEALQSADYNASKNRELSTLLSTIQGSIESLVKEKNLSRERQGERLNSVLDDLKKMQAILG